MKNEQAVRLVSSMIYTALDKHGYTARELCLQTGYNESSLSRSRQGAVKVPLKYRLGICTLLPSLDNPRFTRAMRKQYD